MKRFHYTDLISITTGRLVSTRHMEGVYEILKHMTGDSVYTHQIPRVMQECVPVLCALYPELSNDALAAPLAKLDDICKNESHDRSQRGQAIFDWLMAEVMPLIRHKLPLDEEYTLPVPRLKDGQHLHIDPIEEAEAMFGRDRVMKVSQ